MGVYKKCQSCAMPLKKEEDRGTELLFSRSHKYCINCYQEGEFTQKDLSLEDMKRLVKEKCEELGVPRMMSGLFVRNLHKLERWNQSNQYSKQ